MIILVIIYFYQIKWLNAIYQTIISLQEKDDDVLQQPARSRLARGRRSSSRRRRMSPRIQTSQQSPKQGGPPIRACRGGSDRFKPHPSLFIGQPSVKPRYVTYCSFYIEEKEEAPALFVGSAVISVQSSQPATERNATVGKARLAFRQLPRVGPWNDSDVATLNWKSTLDSCDY